jgi:branched-chain amino acid transport system ATP-binding protein
VHPQQQQRAVENPGSGGPLLSVRDLCVRFRGITALDGVSFDVQPGQIAGLIGPNGAGKTTAFNVITGFLRPSEGEVRYRGTSLNNLKPHEVT